MASWEDGPEYAPLERPSEFSSPSALPLDVVAPTESPAALAPRERPVFDTPVEPVSPLSALVPVVAGERDPARPFQVVTSTLTSMDSAWGAAHWSAPTSAPPQLQAPPAPAPDPYQLTAIPPAAVPLVGPPPAPSPSITSSPTSPLAPVVGPPQLPGGYPPPGTPQWFGPGPAALEPQQAPPRTDARGVLDAITAGVAICLALGALVYVFAPITLLLAFVLSQRVRVATDQVRRAMRTGLAFLGFFALAGFITDYRPLPEWWSYLGGWALAISWVLLVLVPILVYRALKRGETGPSDFSSGWG